MTFLMYCLSDLERKRGRRMKNYIQTFCPEGNTCSYCQRRAKFLLRNGVNVKYTCGLVGHNEKIEQDFRRPIVQVVGEEPDD